MELSLRHERTETGIDLIVCVKDSGSGIREEDMDKLFTSFQQVDSKRNRNVEGTGLGLAISREFANLMHGTITVESTYGEGSTFSFRVPQPVVEDTPSIPFKPTKTVKTASMIANRYVQTGYLKAISYFNVNNIPCGSVADLEAAADQGTEFIFLDSLTWTPETDAFAQAHPEIRVVVIVDPRKEFILAPYVRKLNQPVYSLNIAAVLNREASEYFAHDFQTEEFHFEAPDARVLIVDDNAINLTVAKGLLSPLHMNISVASSAREAIEQLQHTRFDIVFMDHMMPDIDGVEATHMIRAMEGEYSQNLPIIALTANAINNARELFLQEGMNDFVAKPIEMTDISAKIRKWLSSEKIRALDGEAAPAEEKEDGALPKIEGVDTAAGLALAGSVELYRAILKDYYDVIEKKAGLLEEYWTEKNVEAYTIEVHGLKSASRLIGAVALGEQAARLEVCGREKDWGPIQTETPELLRRLRALRPLLEPWCRTEEVREERSLSDEALLEKLECLCGALDDFDIDGARALLEELEACRTDEAGGAVRSRLAEAVRQMEYDDALERAREWQALLR